VGCERLRRRRRPVLSRRKCGLGADVTPWIDAAVDAELEAFLEKNVTSPKAFCTALDQRFDAIRVSGDLDVVIMVATGATTAPPVATSGEQVEDTSPDGAAGEEERRSRRA